MFYAKKKMTRGIARVSKLVLSKGQANLKLFSSMMAHAWHFYEIALVFA
jgi:hypothetical protein